MLDYSGSISGILVSYPDQEINYIAHQAILVRVEQNHQILADKLINQIDSEGKLFEIQFNYNNLMDPIQLIFESHLTDDQINKDYPVSVKQLVVDDLFTVPGFLFSGKLIESGEVVDTGNVLWKFGKLVYNINLPVVSNFNVFTKVP